MSTYLFHIRYYIRFRYEFSYLHIVFNGGTCGRSSVHRKHELVIAIGKFTKVAISIACKFKPSNYALGQN